MINNRRNYRLRKQLDVSWSIPDQKTEGNGIISNISMSGVLFVTDRLFNPEHDLIVALRSTEIPAFPSKGKLMWFRKVGKARTQYQCGVQFLHEAATSPAWIKWMEDNISTLADIGDSKIMDHFVQ